MRLFLLSISIIFTTGFVHGETLVVRQDHPAASDENPATEARPLKTISAAAAKAKAGDRVIIHGGTYREVVIIKSSGTKEAPIIFEAAPGEKPVIKGSDVIDGWKPDRAAVWKAPLKVPPPRDPTGEGSAYWDTNDVRQVFVRDGELLDARRLRRVTAREAMEAGTFFCDTVASMLYVWLADSGSPVQQPPEVSVRAAWLHVSGNHIVVRGIAMRHASTTAIANWPACSLYGHDIVLEDCQIAWGDFVGVSLAGKNNWLSRCLVACHGDAGAGATGENQTIENCRFVYNNVARYNVEWHAGGAKFIPELKRSLIRHNEFAYNLGPGLWLDDRCDDNVIDGNFSHDNEGPGIMVEISSGNLVMNNVTFSNRNYLSGPYRNPEGKDESTTKSEDRIAPSRWLRPYHAGDGRGIYISSSSRTKVLHNTAYLNEAEGICVEGPPRASMATGDYVVMNNISVFNHGSQLTLQPPATGEKPIGISDYNLLFSVGAVLAKNGWNGTIVYDLKQWQTASGHDLHSLDLDPRFAMAAMDDFRVLPGSSALQAGKPLAEVERDFLGQPRGREKVTLGACEAAADNYPLPLWNRTSY